MTISVIHTNLKTRPVRSISLTKLGDNPRRQGSAYETIHTALRKNSSVLESAAQMRPLSCKTVCIHFQYQRHFRRIEQFQDESHKDSIKEIIGDKADTKHQHIENSHPRLNIHIFLFQLALHHQTYLPCPHVN